MEVSGLRPYVGEVCRVEVNSGKEPVLAEVELYLFRELGILGRRLMEIATQKQDNH